MSEQPESDEGQATSEDYYEGGARKKRGRSIPGCLAALVALALIVGGGYIAVTKGAEFIKEQFSSTPDYPGPGKGKVSFQIAEGDTGGAIGRKLKSAGVVESVDAFLEAAGDFNGYQVGYYKLKKEMRAADAFEILSNPDKLIKTAVTIPEGLRLTDILDLLATRTDFSRAQFEKALKSPAKLGLPDYANGSAEGYLFPSTYDVTPDSTPASVLKMMIDKWQAVAEDTDLEAKASALGVTPGELMTIASLVEAEGRGDYTPKIAQVIYNRLDTEGYPTFGKLQIDATVNYALNRSLVAIPTLEDTKVDSPYNTYAYPGLPPGPIEAPGEAAIQAALDPEPGDWLFYVTVNLKTGETKFTESYDEFLSFKAELQEYCDTQSDRC